MLLIALGVNPISALLCFACLFVLHLGIYNATVDIVVIDTVAIASR